MTHVVGLRPLSVEDAADMAEVLADPSLYEYTGGQPPTVDELARRYAVQTRGHSSDGSQEWVNLVVIIEGQPIGYVQATIARDGGPTEIAWVIGRPWQGRGHGARAARLLLDDLAERGIVEVVAHIHPEHIASQTVAARLGMRPTGIVVDGETCWAGLTR